MSKYNNETKATEEKVNQPEGAKIAPEGVAAPAVSEETLSHQYQKDSNAINTNVAAGYPAATSDNVVAKLGAKEDETKATEGTEEIDEAEYLARTKLDVSDVRYINPSLDHYKLSKKKGK